MSESITSESITDLREREKQREERKRERAPQSSAVIKALVSELHGELNRLKQYTTMYTEPK